MGYDLLREILIYLGLEIGHADKAFASREHDAITAIITALGLKPADFGLSTKAA